MSPSPFLSAQIVVRRLCSCRLFLFLLNFFPGFLDGWRLLLLLPRQARSMVGASAGTQLRWFSNFFAVPCRGCSKNNKARIILPTSPSSPRAYARIKVRRHELGLHDL